MEPNWLLLGRILLNPSRKVTKSSPSSIKVCTYIYISILIHIHTQFIISMITTFCPFYTNSLFCFTEYIICLLAYIRHICLIILECNLFYDDFLSYLSSYLIRIQILFRQWFLTQSIFENIDVIRDITFFIYIDGYLVF